MNKIEVGNAPCSWGTLEFEGYNVNPIGYTQMLDELVETGYTATELGDWGFMPTDPKALQHEIDSRNLAMLGAYVQVAFKYPEAIAPGREEVLKIARLMRDSTPSRKPYIILADNNAEEPARAAVAGRAAITPGVSLSSAEWDVFARGVREVAQAVKDETGLPVLFHHHNAGYVETPAEIDCLLERVDKSLLNLVFDAGHFVFGSGPNSPYSSGNIVPWLETHTERISYIHLKDCDPKIAARSRAEEWGYIKTLSAGVFCELGKGCVDFPGLVKWLEKTGYTGWALVEQDVLPGMGEPKESAQRNRDYLRSIGL
jgi:inosose dehydratase